jgi:sulfane dehydrogenase subunit SoxC
MPVLPRAHTRFRWPWTWDGTAAQIASRCTDDTGYTQPLLAELIKVRGVNSQYHNNGVQMWKVAPDGTISNGNRA